MADLTITAASVAPSTNARFLEDKVLAATLTAGQVVYANTADKYDAASTVTSATTATVAGILVGGGSLNQRVSIQFDGKITIGATVAVGTIYVLSTAGLIAPAADLLSNDWVSVIGVATSATEIDLAIFNSGVQVP